MSVHGGVFRDNSNADTITAGPDGRLTVPKHEGEFLLVVVADAGFADATSNEFPRPESLSCSPGDELKAR